MTDLCEWKGKCRKISWQIYAMLRSRGLDTEMMMWALSHLRAATMRIPRSGAEQKIGPAWGEAARPAGEHQQILRARITASSQARALDIQFAYSDGSLFIIFATKCNRIQGYIYLRKICSCDFKTKTKSFLCLICILFRNTTSDGFISMPSKERNDHLFRAFSSIWGHLLFVMTWTWHWRFTSERQML